jgi:phenylacetate-CoA ligase
VYTALVSRVLFPLHERAKRHATTGVMRGMERSQWLPPAALADLQLGRLRALLAQAQQVPYWRELFARTGFDPAAVRSVADLQALPLLDKAAIRAHADAMKHPRARGLARFNTGGSSGEPLIFFIGRERVSHDVAAKWRATRWWGVDIGDPEIVVWGSPIELGAQDRVRALRDRLLRTELLPAFEMNEPRLDAMVAAIRARRPRMLFGYPSALTHIARHARARRQRMDDLGLKVAFVTSERLYDDQRRDIEQVFGCPVANGYGGRDAGFIAHQCPHGSLHVTAEDIVVEIVGPDGRALPAGQSGEIVVTHLATRDFPFIRYRTGDVGVLDDKPCACGRGLPVLKEVQGRSTDFVVAADGTVMHGLALIYTLRDIPGLRQFKVVQESTALTRVQIVPGPGCDVHAATVRIRRDFAARLGRAVEVQVDVVDAIPAERSGKFRYVVSRVAVAQAA